MFILFLSAIILVECVFQLLCSVQFGISLLGDVPYGFQVLCFISHACIQNLGREDIMSQESVRFSSVEKFDGNPIISPDEAVYWRSQRTLNPTAVYLDEKIHLLYRAIGADCISRFGYANSIDGFHIDECLVEPVYREPNEMDGFSLHSLEFGGSISGCEDPRMVFVKDEGVIYIIYTSCVDGLGVALSSISKDDFLAKRWNWRRPQRISVPGEVHKNWVLFPEKIRGKYAILHAMHPISIAYVDTLEFGGSYISSHYSSGSPSDRWDSYMRGVGPAPIKTEYGWLLFYHAMDHHDMSEYKVGAMLLDLQDPTNILCRSRAPIIVPEESYEVHGCKEGVVFALGVVVKGDMLLLYYGAADNYVCVAFADLSRFLKELMAAAVTSL